MKKLFLLFVVLIYVKVSKSQVVFEIVSNTCDTNTLGSYPFEYACELDGSSIDWSCPDITNPANAVQGCMVFINDGVNSGGIGTPPTTINYAFGCDTTNSTNQDLTGKIAVIYRGTCEFGLKAYNAQLRGAIGVIIINHTGAPTNMAGNTYGINVTIPVIQISRADGDAIAACIDTVCNGVVGFIGNRTGYYSNNMSSSMGDILMPENLSTPQHLAPNGTVFPVDLGLYAYNTGTNAQSGVTATVTVVRQSNGSTVYSQTSSSLDFNGLDTIFVDTQYIDLGTYAPSFWDIDTYTVTYTIDATADDYLADNIFSYEFKITNYEHGGFYSKSRTDDNSKPISNKYYSIESSIPEDVFDFCIVYRTPSSFFNGCCLYAEKLTFSCLPFDQTITGKDVDIIAYKWNDGFIDLDTPPTFNNFEILSNGYYQFTSETEVGQPIDVYFDTPVLPETNQRYLFCVSSFSYQIKVGFDDFINYKSTMEHYKQPINPMRIGHFAILSQTDWYINGYFGVTPAIVVNFMGEVGIDNINNEIMYFPYPNPTTNLLTIPLRKGVSGAVKVEVFDLTGKLVLSENQTIANEPLKVNVASIKNGTYLFQLTFADGTTDLFKISVNR